MPEFGLECSLGLGAPQADPRLRQLLLHSLLEVQQQPASSQRPALSLVTVTRNPSTKLVNSQLLMYMRHTDI